MAQLFKSITSEVKIAEYYCSECETLIVRGRKPSADWVCPDCSGVKYFELFQIIRDTISAEMLDFWRAFQVPKGKHLE
mgnify:CR=1 FL=1